MSDFLRGLENYRIRTLAKLHSGVTPECKQAQFAGIPWFQPRECQFFGFSPEGSLRLAMMFLGRVLSYLWFLRPDPANVPENRGIFWSRRPSVDFLGGGFFL